MKTLMKTKKMLFNLVFLAILNNQALAHEAHTVETKNDNNNLFTKALASQQEEDYLAAYTFYKKPEAQTLHGATFKLAYLQQHFHEFDQALETLSQLNKSAQTSLLQASIYFTQGKIAEAKSACSVLIGKAEHLLTTTCITKAMSRNGQLKKGYATLRDMTEKYKSAPNDALHWAYATLAEMALRLGMSKESENYYQKTLVIKPADVVTRIEYADLLLSEKRYRDVIKLTAGDIKHAAIFIRFVRAKRGLGDPRARFYNPDLKATVRAMETRDQHLHYDTLAEHSLFIENNPQQALKWAQLHWAQQKTPRDALLLAKAARVSGDAEALKEVVRWKKNVQLEDAALKKYLAS